MHSILSLQGEQSDWSKEDAKRKLVFGQVNTYPKTEEKAGHIPKESLHKIIRQVTLDPGGKESLLFLTKDPKLNLFHSLLHRTQARQQQ